MKDLLEKLSKMFFKQDYQSRLEQYIASKNPKSIGEIEQLERQYFYTASKSLI